MSAALREESPNPQSEESPVTDPNTAPASQERALVRLSHSGKAWLVPDSIVKLLANMLPPVDNKGNKRSMTARINQIKLAIVRDPSNQHAPMLATVNTFPPAAQASYAGDFLQPKTKADGSIVMNGDKPVMEWVSQGDVKILGHTMLPDSHGSSRLVMVEDARPLITLDGNGGYIPYCDIDVIDGAQQFSGRNIGVCLFLYDFNVWTYEFTTKGRGNQGRPEYGFVPFSLGDPEKVALWNEYVQRRLAQDPEGYAKAAQAELVTEQIPHNLYGRAVLCFEPQGHPQMGGLIKWRQSQYMKRPKTILGRVMGKNVAFNKPDMKLLMRNGQIPPHKLRIREGWDEIRVLSVDGIWGDNTRADVHVVDGTEASPHDALKALGIPLIAANRNMIRGAVRRACSGDPKASPVFPYLVNRQELEADVDPRIAKSAIRALRTVFEAVAVEQIDGAIDRLMSVLGGGTAGMESGGMPSFLDIAFGGVPEDERTEPTPELLLEIFVKVDPDCLLGTFIAASNTAEAMNLDEWDPTSQVMSVVRKLLLKQIAYSQHGLKLPPRHPAKEQKPESEQDASAVAQSEGEAQEDSSSDDEQSNGNDAPAFVWDESWPGKVLVKLARDNNVEGVKANTKADDVREILRDVCPPTPGAPRPDQAPSA